MFSEKGLRTSFLVFLATSILFFFLDWKTTGHDLLMVATIMAALQMAFHPYKVPRRVWRVFHNRFAYNELQRFLVDNPECGHSLNYAALLPPEDLLKFFRLVVEARYGWDQNVLIELARLINEEQGKGDVQSKDKGNS